MQTLCFTRWENGHEAPDYPLNSELPRLADTYSPGHRTMGCDPRRGQAIQFRRLRKRFEANRAQFLAFLPQIEARLTPEDWRALSRALRLPEFTPARGGLVLYGTPDGRRSWIHPTLEPDLISRALALGATPTP